MGLFFVARGLLIAPEYDPTTALILVVLYYVLIVAAIGMEIYGCYCWAKYKGRNKWLCLLGLVAPIGFIPLALLKDKSVAI